MRGALVDPGGSACSQPPCGQQTRGQQAREAGYLTKGEAHRDRRTAPQRTRPDLRGACARTDGAPSGTDGPPAGAEP